MTSQLRQLSCFNNITHITRITTGMSNECYKVNADGQEYFAKTLSANNEAAISLLAAKQGISPPVFFHNQQWLITQFMLGENLADSTKNQAKKINIAVQLMAQCHQLPATKSPMSALHIASDLIKQVQLPLPQQQQLNSIIKQLSTTLTANHKLVCCHGDMNFSNVLLDTQQHAWLVDFECAYVAAAEFDVAMLVAINNLDVSTLTPLITAYQQANPQVVLNQSLLQQYLLFSYLINGLWYFQKFQQTAVSSHATHNKATYKQLALQQWQQFDDLALPTLTNQALVNII